MPILLIVAVAGTASAAAGTLKRIYLIPPPLILNKKMLYLPAIDINFVKAFDLAGLSPTPPMICIRQTPSNM